VSINHNTAAISRSTTPMSIILVTAAFNLEPDVVPGILPISNKEAPIATSNNDTAAALVNAFSMFNLPSAYRTNPISVITATRPSNGASIFKAFTFCIFLDANTNILNAINTADNANALFITLSGSNNDKATTAATSNNTLIVIDIIALWLPVANLETAIKPANITPILAIAS